MNILEGALLTASTYLAVGFLFGVAFAFKGAAAIDSVAREGTWGFRLIIVPGAAALWPLLLLRWIASMKP